MKKIIVLSSVFCSMSFAAQPVFHSLGASSTLGSITNSRALSTSLSNPASGYLMVDDRKDDSFRYGLIGPIGIGYELGEVDSLIDQIDKLEKIIDDGVNLDGITTQAEADAEVKRVEGVFNTFLADAGEKGYAKATVVGAVPFFPIIYKSEKYGALALDFTFSGAGKLNVLNSNLNISVIQNGLDFVTTATTDSSLYIQTAIATTFGLGYSNRLWDTGYGDLIVGIKANATQMDLTRSVEKIETQGDGDEAEGEESSANVGVDVGLLWVANNVIFGVTMANINEPEYDLGLLENCTGSTANCTVVTNFANAGDIKLEDTYVAEAQTTAELSLSLADKTLSLHGSYDLNSVKDAVGDEYQWSVASLSYYGDSNWLPGLRVGLRQNMVGTELSYANAGLTFFKRLNLDVGVSLETIEVDGTELPRAGYVNLGFSSAF